MKFSCKMEQLQKYAFVNKVPYGYNTYYLPNYKMTNSVTCNFVGTFRQRLSKEWTPTNKVVLDLPDLIKPTEIHYKKCGMIPNYTGHIPGAMFRYGATFGSDTKDAKRWLRGDYS